MTENKTFIYFTYILVFEGFIFHPEPRKEMKILNS